MILFPKLSFSFGIILNFLPYILCRTDSGRLNVSSCWNHFSSNISTYIKSASPIWSKIVTLPEYKISK